eukprot:4929270-Prymnesium_polylepis.1
MEAWIERCNFTLGSASAAACTTCSAVRLSEILCFASRCARIRSRSSFCFSEWQRHALSAEHLPRM